MEFTAAVANELALSIENCELRTAAVNNEKMAAVGLAITNLAHNIRNLLNVNVNFVELLDLQLQDIQNGDIRKSWGYVRSGLEKIAGLTADIMEYTTVDTGEPETTDINSSVQMQCELVRQNLESEGIALEVKLTPNLPPCSICDVRLQRALLNLVINAKQALKETKNGCIKISTEKDDRGNVVTRVSDNGCGIPKEHLNRIFDLFFTTKGTDGSGLGLPMVKKFVESNGGRLSVVSQVGVGSVVTITLPPAAGAAATA
jgi:signal transduction histidine kinase